MSAYWFDTDPGIDDALAILMALRTVDYKIAGFSTVHGNHPEAVSARNLARLLSHYEAHNLTPPGWLPWLVRGSDRPLVRQAVDSKGVHGSDGLGDLNWQARPPWTGFLEGEPVSLNKASHELGPLRLICLGPLTNMARAIQDDRAFIQRVAQLVIMGGSLRAGGNSSMAAEHNFWADPEAAHLVLQAGFSDLRLVPIDAVASARFNAAHLARLDKIKTPMAAIVRELLTPWRPRIGQRGQAMYDLLAWLLTIHPEWADWEEVYVDVDTAGGLAYGATIADWRGRSGQSPNVKAALSVRGDLMWDYFLEVLAEA